MIRSKWSLTVPCNRWVAEGFGARAHDVVLISDVDEIPRPEVVRTLRDCAEAMPGGVRLHMDW
jgi:hypothetical protein